MRKGATTPPPAQHQGAGIVALRNEKGSYNHYHIHKTPLGIVALRNEKGSYNALVFGIRMFTIVALRNEKGSYNRNWTRI